MVGSRRVRQVAYLTDIITRIVNGHPNSQLNELMPWAYQAAVVKVG